MDKVRIVDAGDADIVHTDTAASHRNAELAVRKILESGALPVVLGGDHAVNIPCVRAFSDELPIHIVQIDAHLDFVDVRHGVREGHGNPMRRAAEQAHVAGITQLGIRNVSSTAREGYEDARRRGSVIRSVRQCRQLGTKGVLDLIPPGVRYYVTIDIDGFDPSIAPGTGTPSHGGFLYWEVMELLQGLARRGRVVGIDLVEVAPAYDPSGITAMLAAQVLLNFLGYIFHARDEDAAEEKGHSRTCGRVLREPVPGG
jgi:agmatinase